MNYTVHLTTGAIIEASFDVTNAALPSGGGTWLVDDNGVMLKMSCIAAMIPAVTPTAAPVPTGSLVQVLDREGDVWTLRSNGKYSISTHVGMRSLEEVTANYGPMEAVVPPAAGAPFQVRDREGDTWTRREDGRYTLTGGEGGSTLEYIEENYGPVKVVIE